MKNIRKKLLLLVTAGLLAALTATPVMAEHKDLNGSCYFDGTKIVSDFDSKQIADAVTNLQPGDDVSFTVEYKNDFDATTDWYMENKILQTLEKASMSNKQVSGTGKAEHGAYTYELIHYNNSGEQEVLFSNREVGGDTVKEGMEGLEQATNALDEWFFIQTLEKGQSGRVVLNVAFDGETEVNDYMDTDGGLAVRFAVELPPATPTPTPTPAVTPAPSTTPGPSNPSGGTTPGTGSSVTRNAVKTGDPTNLPLLIGLLAAGVVLLIVALVLRKKHQGADVEEGYDDNMNQTGGQ